MNLKKALERYSPRLVSEGVYVAALKSFQLGSEIYGGKTHVQVWARNSYRLGNWIPFQSDIDLSVWLAKEPTSKDLSRLRATHQAVKRVFPILGEIYLYVATDQRRVEMLINRFELERDPQLGKKLGARSPLDARYHAASFLLRMLESDIARVLEEPEGRRPKWDFHVARITEGLGTRNYDIWAGFPRKTLLRGIVELIAMILDPPPEERQKFTEQAELYFQSVGRKVPSYLLSPLLADQPYLWAAFPHRFCFKTESRPVLQGIWGELAQAQVSWELFGMLTQYRLWVRSESERATLRTHLSGLLDFYQTSIQKGSRHSELDSMVSEMIEYLLRNL